MVNKFMIEKLMDEEFMVEKFMVEEFMVEMYSGWKYIVVEKSGIEMSCNLLLVDLS